MKKYLYGFKLYFLNSFEYRFNTVVGLLFGNLSTLITIFFWRLIYSGDTQTTLNGYTLSGIITYFVVGNIFRGFILQSSGFTYTGMIKDGTLGSMLLKPYNISLAIYFRNLASGITGLIPQVLFVICLMPFIARYLTWQMSLFDSAFVLLFLVIGSISSHLLWSLFGYMAFWLEEANAVMWSFAVLLNVATGMFIPLDFFPKWSIPVLEALPFSSWGYIPAKIYLGLYEIDKLIWLTAVHVIWIGVLILLHKLIWSVGMKKYSSVGG
jgi:ABC-2 type transport system permease protein